MAHLLFSSVHLELSSDGVKGTICAISINTIILISFLLLFSSLLLANSNLSSQEGHSWKVQLREANSVLSRWLPKLTLTNDRDLSTVLSKIARVLSELKKGYQPKQSRPYFGLALLMGIVDDLFFE